MRAFAPTCPARGAACHTTQCSSCLLACLLAFDHARILAEGVERARAKLKYTPLATAFVRLPFTISEHREVYETVWGEKLHSGNFHRKVLSVPGFVESTGDQTESGGPQGRRPPREPLPPRRRGPAPPTPALRPALLCPAIEEPARHSPTKTLHKRYSRFRRFA